MPAPPAVVQAAGTALVASPSFSTPVELDTYDSYEMTFHLLYTKGAGNRPIFMMQVRDPYSGLWKNWTIQDTTITVVAGIGFENDIDSGIIRGPSRDFAQSFSVVVANADRIRVSVADEGPGLGALGVNVSWSARRKNQ